MATIGRTATTISVRLALAGLLFGAALHRSVGAENQGESQPPARASRVVLGTAGSLVESVNATDGAALVAGMDVSTTQPIDDKRGRFVVVPIPFRNALLGAGLTLGAGYLYQPKDAVIRGRHSVAGVGGMYTEGESWALAGGHRAYWSRERYRTTLGLGTGELNYDLELTIQDVAGKVSLAQEFEGGKLGAEIKVGSHGWLGLGVTYGETVVRVASATVAPPAELRPDATITLTNLVASGEWDSRDSDMYPRTGRQAEAEAQFSRQDLGSDSDYERLKLEYNGYHSINERQVLAYRIAGEFVSGDAPFFALAWFGSGVDLRGYTPGRYIGTSMIAAQTEWRWQATARWGFVAFGGAGKVSGVLGDVDTSEWLPAGGAGVRFRLLKSLDLNMRADYAWGRDDSTFTLSVGEAF